MRFLIRFNDAEIKIAPDQNSVSSPIPYIITTYEEADLIQRFDALPPNEKVWAIVHYMRSEDKENVQ